MDATAHGTGGHVLIRVADASRYGVAEVDPMAGSCRSRKNPNIQNPTSRRRPLFLRQPRGGHCQTRNLHRGELEITEVIKAYIEEE